MALGLFLWVAWISLLSSAGLTMARDTFRHGAASQNLRDHEDDFPSISFDEGDLKDPAESKPTNLVYTSFNTLSLPKQLNLAPTGQNPSAPQSTPGVDRIVNGEVRRWQSKLYDPITFPLSSGNQNADPPKLSLPAIQLQSAPLNVYSKPDAPTPSYPTSYKPAQSLSMAMSSPGFESWQSASAPKIPGGHGVAEEPLTPKYQEFNTGSSGSDSSNEVVFQRRYPYGSDAVKPPVAYATSSNTADKLDKGSSMNEVQSYTPVRYGFDNRVDTTGYPSAPQEPSFKYPLVNIKPYEGFPYHAEGYGQKSQTNPEPPVHMFPPQKSPQHASVNAISDSKPAAESYSQGNMPSTEYASPPKQPFFQSAVGTDSSTKDWMDVPFSSIFGEGFPDFKQMDSLSDNSVFNMKGSVPKVYQMPPKPLRKTFFIRTKNNYRRGRYTKSKTTYTPVYKMQDVSTSVVKGPAQAPKAEGKVN